MRKKEIMEKTAFKCTSIKKDMSLKKRPEVLSITKSVIAHKTRGARRKHDHKWFGWNITDFLRISIEDLKKIKNMILDLF